MSSLKAKLEKAFALIDAKEKWIQGHLARDKNGMSVDTDSPEATCFCSMGAICASHAESRNDEYEERMERALDAAAQSIDPICCNYVSFNDDHSYEDVVRMWKQAIKDAE